MDYEPWPGIGLSDSRIDWAKAFGSPTLSAKSTANVERRRKEGKDFSTFRGISRKSDELSNRGAPAKMKRVGLSGVLQSQSKSGQIREALRGGPMTRAEICFYLGIKPTAIGGHMENDIKQGRIVKIAEEGELQRFALAEATHA